MGIVAVDIIASAVVSCGHDPVPAHYLKFQACLTMMDMSDTIEDMTTNTRNFLRSFTTYKAKARKGETVRVQDKEFEFLFIAAVPQKSLSGSARGKIGFKGDPTKPTLRNEDWKASL